MESLVETILQKILGDYIERDLKIQNFNFFSVSGYQLDIENVHLKKTALAGLELPIEIREAIIGKLIIILPPVSEIMTKPWQFHIEQLFVLTAPCFRHEDKQEDLIARKLSSKLRLLEISELMEIDQEKKLAESHLDKTVVSIVENLQIFVKDIHIRFEDAISNKVPFSFGVTIDHASFESCNSAFEKAAGGVKAGDARSIVYKIVSLTRLSVYMNTPATLLEWKDINSLKKLMSDMIPRTDNCHDYNFILAPLSMETKVALDSREHVFENPKVDVGLETKRLQFCLSSAQFRSLLNLLFWTKNYTRRLLYCEVYEHRPHKFIMTSAEAQNQKDTAEQPNTTDTASTGKASHAHSNQPNERDWWRYAVRCMLHKIHTRKAEWNFQHMKQFAADKLVYCKAITEGKSPDVQQAIEAKYNLEQLLFLRRYARASKEYEAKFILTKNQFVTGLAKMDFLNVFSKEEEKKEDQKKSDEERIRAIYDIMAHRLVTNSKEERGYPKPYIHTVINTSIEEFIVDIQGEFKEKVQTILQGTLKGINIKSFLRAEWQTIDVGIKEFSLSDFTTMEASGEEYPILKSLVSAQNQLFLKIDCDVKPITTPPNAAPLQITSSPAPTNTNANTNAKALVVPKKQQDQKRDSTELQSPRPANEEAVPSSQPIDLRLKLKLQPLVFRFSMPLMKLLTTEFGMENEREVMKSLVENIYTEELSKLNKETLLKIKSALEERAALDLDIDISAPTVIFPQRAADRSSEAIVVDLGHFLLRSVLSSERQPLPKSPRSRTNSAATDEPRTPRGSVRLEPPVSPGREKAQQAKELAARCYDRFDVQLTGISMVIYQDISKFIECPEEVDKNLKCNISTSMEVLMAPLDEYKFKMTGRLSNVELNISPQDITTVLNVATTCSRAILGSQKDLALLFAPIEATDVHLADYIAEAEEIPNMKVLTASIFVDSAKVRICQPVQGRNTEIVVAVTAFEMTVDATSQQSHLNLGLGQLFVEDLFLPHNAQDEQRANRYLVSSVEAVGKMLSAEINISTLEDHSEFAQVRLNLQGLNVDVDRHTVVRMMQFVGKISKQSIQNFNDQLQKLKKLVPEKPRKNVSNKITEVANVVVGITKSVRISLIKEARPFLMVALTDMNLTCQIRSDETASIKGNVDNLDISFRDPNDQWIKLLWVTTKNAQLVQFDVVTVKDMPYAASLKMALASYSIMHHHHAILEVGRFVFVLMDMLDLSNTDLKNLKTTQAPPPSVLYEVNVANPILILPADAASSAKQWSLDLGCISISNKLFALKDKPRLFDHHKEALKAQEARRREAKSDGSEIRTDEWYLQQAQQAQKSRERAASKSHGTAHQVESKNTGAPTGLLENLAELEEEEEREECESIERALEDEIAATQDIVIDQLQLELHELRVDSHINGLVRQIATIPRAVFLVAMPKENAKHTIPETSVDACVYDVQIDTNEDSIWVLFDIIQRNFLLLPIREDVEDMRAFKAAHGLGGQTPAPLKKKRKYPWAVTDLDFRITKLLFQIASGTGESEDGTPSTLLTYHLDEFFFGFQEDSHFGQEMRLRVNQISVLNALISHVSGTRTILELKPTEAVPHPVAIDVKIPEPKRVTIDFRANCPIIYADSNFLPPFITHILPMGKEMLESLDLMERVYPKGGLNMLGIVKNDIVKLGMTFTLPRIYLIAKKGGVESNKAFELKLDSMQISHCEQKSGAKNMVLDLKNCTVFSTNYHLEQNYFFDLSQIVPPFMLGLDLDESDTGDLVVRLHLLSLIKLILTFNDLGAILRLATAFQPVMDVFGNLFALLEKRSLQRLAEEQAEAAVIEAREEEKLAEMSGLYDISGVVKKVVDESESGTVTEEERSKSPFKPRPRNTKRDMRESLSFGDEGYEGTLSTSPESPPTTHVAIQSQSEVTEIERSVKSQKSARRNTNEDISHLPAGKFAVSPGSASSASHTAFSNEATKRAIRKEKERKDEEKTVTVKIDNTTAGGFEIEILDDTNFVHSSIPLAKANLPKLAVFLELAKGGKSVHCEVEIIASMSAYNDMLQIWEPFMEPFPIFLQSQVEETSLKVLVHTKREHMIDFNITTSFLDRVVKAHSYLTKMGLFDSTSSFLESSAGGGAKRQAYPLMIKNKTGKEMDYTIPGSAQIIRLPVGEEREFIPEKNNPAVTMTAAVTSEDQMDVIQFERQYKLKDINYQTIGTHCSNGLVMDVSHEGSSKIIEFRSNIYIHNCLAEKIDIQLIEIRDLYQDRNKTRDKVVIDTALAPNGKFPIPLQCAELGKFSLSIRPSSAFKWAPWDMSKESIISDSEQSLWFCSSTLVYKKLNDNAMDIVIIFAAELVLHNFLCSSLSYKIDDVCTTEAGESLNKGDSRSITMRPKVQLQLDPVSDLTASSSRLADLRSSSTAFGSSSHLPNASLGSQSLQPGARSRTRKFSNAQKTTNVYLDSQGFQSDYFEILNTTDSKCKEIVVFIPGFHPEKIQIARLSISSPTDLILRPEQGNGDLLFKVQLFFTNSGCTKNIKVWSAYWIINYTDLRLTYSYKGGRLLAGQGQHQQPKVTNAKGNLTYASDPTIALRHECFAWCEAIDFTSTQIVSTTAVVRTPTWDFHLSLSMAKAPLRFSDTQIIEIRPMFFIVNNTPYALLLRLGRLSTPLLLREKEQKALHFPAKTTDEDRHLALCFPKYKSATAEIVIAEGEVMEDYSEIEFSDFERVSVSALSESNKDAGYQWVPQVPVSMDKFQAGVTFKMKQNIELVGNVKYVNNMAYLFINVQHMSAEPYGATVPKKDIDIKVCNVSIGLSLINAKPQELLYIFLHNIQFEFQTNLAKRTELYRASMQRFQIDNQLYGTPHAVILSPVRMNAGDRLRMQQQQQQQTSVQSMQSTGGEVAAEWLNLYAVRIVTDYDEQIWDQIVLILAPFEVAMDEACFATLLDYVEDIQERILLTGFKQEQMILNDMQESLKLSDADLEKSVSKKCTIRELAIPSFKVFISFSASVESREDGSHGKLKDFILKLHLGFGVKLSDIFDLIECIDGASITIPGFSQGFNEPVEDIAMALGKKYAESWKMGWITQVLAHSDISGATYLASNVSISVISFFKEPYRGAVADGAAGMGKGIARGTGNLVTGIVDGVMGFASISSRGLGTALAKVSGNEEFEKERRIAKQKGENVANNLPEGLYYGLVNSMSGVVNGALGTVVEPLKGAQTGGVPGFFKGLGVGLVGVFARPVIGVLDGVSSITEGVQNTVKPVEKSSGRLRDPRYFGANKVLEIYNPLPAAGQKILHTLNNGRYKYHYYLYHAEINPETMILFSTTRMFCLTISRANKQDIQFSWSSSRVCSMDYGSQDEKKDLEVHFYTELYEKKVRKLAIKNQECRPKLLEMIERIATIKPQNLAQSICPHLSHQKYKEGYLLASTGAPERPSVKSRCYCAHGKMHWMSSNFEVTFAIRINNCSLISRLSCFDSNTFAIVTDDPVSKETKTFYFTAITQEEKIEWINTCLNNGAFFIETYRKMPPCRLYAFKAEDSKLFLDADGRLSCSSETKRGDETMFWVEEETPLTVYIKANNPKNQKYFSVHPNGAIVADKAKKDDTCRFQMLELGSGTVAFKTCAGGYISLRAFRLTTNAPITSNTTSISSSTTVNNTNEPSIVKRVETDSLAPFPFSCIHPQVYVLIRVLAALEQRENRFVSVITSNTDPSLPRTMHTSLASKKASERGSHHERFLLRPVGTKDHLSFLLRSMATGLYLSVCENGDLKANYEIKGGTISRSARFFILRELNGDTLIQSCENMRYFTVVKTASGLALIQTAKEKEKASALTLIYCWDD